MKRTLVMVGTTLAVLAGAFCLMPGCEDDADTGGDALDNYFKNHPYVSDPRSSSDSDVIISPGQATVSALGEEVLFSAKGGDGAYTWDVADAGAGHLETVLNGATIDNSQRRYKVDILRQNNVIVYDGDGDAAIGDINVFTASLQISPAAVDIGTAGGDIVQFIASGGLPPYSWSVTFPQLVARGGVVATGANSETGTYTSVVGTGTNGVTLLDSVGNTVLATVEHN